MSDFRGETIYFLVVDRFADGNPANNFGRSSEDFDATHTDWYKYWGGDLRGVLDKLDYLQSLGASAIWMTPIFDQVDGTVDINGVPMAPYHGYWAKDFKRLDEHLVDRPEDVRVFATDQGIFDELVGEMHRRGMKLVLDIVCNHSNPHMGGGRGELYDDGRLVAAFGQGNWYRAAAAIEDWNDLAQIQSRDLAGLADFDEESWEYRQYIKGTMKLWLDKGVDAFRVDTVKHMPLWFWQEFTGDLEVHRADLFVFGEWFQGGCWDEESVTFASKSGMSMLDFAWRTAVVECLAHRSARGFEQVQEVIDKDVLYRDPTGLVTFVDNHDLPRFLSLSDDRARFRLAVLLTLVARGVPCLYYGNEQYLHVDLNRGNDPYNRPMMPNFDLTPFGTEIAILAALRKASPAVQRGGMRKKWLDPDRYAFTRCWLGSHVLVAVNRGNEEASLGLMGIELPDGVYQDVLGGPPIEVLEATTRVVVPPKSIVVYSTIALLPAGRVAVDLQAHGIRTDWGEQLYVCGDAPELGKWDITKAVRMEYVNQNTWGTTVAFDASAGREIHYKFILKRKNGTWSREPGRGHHRRVPREPLPKTTPSAVDAIWRDNWRT